MPTIATISPTLPEPLAVATTPTALPEPLAAATAPPTFTAEPTRTPQPTATWVVRPRGTPTPLGTPATGISSSQRSVGQTLLDAIERTQSATVYRLEITSAGKGGFETLLYYLGLTDPREAAVLHDHAVACNEDNCYATLKGGTAGLFGVDREIGLQAMTVDGDGYMRGPIPYLEMNEDKWYVFPGEANPLAVPSAHTSELYAYLDERKRDLEQFERVALEIFDGRRCDVYATVDGDVVFRALRYKFGGNMTAGGVDFEGVGNTELKIWICDDGYLHQMQMRFAGHDQSQPERQIERSYRLHLFDFDAAIEITPPSDAVPLPDRP
jgi:hypothetical protein